MKYKLEKHGVTQGLLATFMECRQKAKWKLQLWQAKGSGISSAMDWGINMHKVFERMHKWQMRHAFKAPPEALVLKEVVLVYKDYRKSLRDARLSQKDEQEVELMEAQSLAIAPAYFTYWDKRQKAKLHWTDAEGVFEIPYKWKDGKTVLRGRIDGVYEVDKLLWLMDTKTKTMIQEEHFGEPLLRNWQVNFYMLAVWLLTGKIPAGFLYDVVRRPSLKLGKNESLTTYVERVHKHMKEEGYQHYFKRYEVKIIKKDLNAFKEELDQLLTEFKAWLSKGMPSPLFGMPCVQKWGLCEYVGMDFGGSKRGFEKREVFFPELED